MSDDDALKQETCALQQMTEAERKLLVGLEEFIKGKVALSGHAYAIVAEILYARQVRARDRRRTFRVV